MPHVQAPPKSKSGGEMGGECCVFQTWGPYELQAHGFQNSHVNEGVVLHHGPWSRPKVL